MSPAQRRVLHLVPEARGGICRHVVALCQELPSRGWSCMVTAPQGSLDRMIEFGLPEETDRIPLGHLLPGPRDLVPAIEPAALARVRNLARIGDRLVHAHGYRAGLLAGLARFRPSILTAHNLPPDRSRLILKRSLRTPDALVAISPAVADQLVELGAPVERVRVIPNGIAVPPLPTPEQKADARRQLLELLPQAKEGEASAAGPLLLGVGRLSPEKGFDVLLQALPQIRVQFPEVCLVLVGDGPERATLEEAVPEDLRPRVAFAGHRSDATALLPGADLVVIPSRAEGQSLVALEALAVGLPVVASDVGGLPSMIRPGETGWLAQATDPNDLARGVLEALAVAPASGAEARRSFVRKHFSLEESMRRLLGLYNELLQGHP